MAEAIDILLSRSNGAGYPNSPLQVVGIFLVVFFTLAATIVCVLRMKSRCIIKSLGLDDLLIIAATLLTLNQGWTAIVFMRYSHMGVHITDDPPNDTQTLPWFYNWLCVVFNAPIIWLVKISVLVFLLRLSGLQNRRVRISIYCMIAMVTGIMIAVECVIFFQCRPFQLAWTTAWFQRDGLGWCVDVGIFLITSQALVISTDLLVMLVPFVILLDLKINKRMRNTLIGVFMLGGIVTILSAVRLYLVWRVFYQARADPAYTIGFVIATVESNLAIVIVSIPALWPLGRRWFPSMNDRLGINRVHQADIEFQDISVHGNLTIGSRAPRIKVKWVRRAEVKNDIPAEQQLPYPGSPEMMARADSRNFRSSRGGDDGEGNTSDGVLPPNVSTAPLFLPHDKCGEDEKAGDYFGNLGGALAAATAAEEGQRPDAECDDLYHDMIATMGHTSPYGNHNYTAYDRKTAYYSSETPDSNLKRQSGYHSRHSQHELVESSDSTAYTVPILPEPALFRLTLPPRAVTAPLALLRGRWRRARTFESDAMTAL